MLTGFFRKCVIADVCGMFVNRVYSDIGSATSLAVFAAGLLFIMQIYNDFAGYSEIAMGAARMMGVKLSVNFDRPFTALSLSEFFRRWHITLNRWFSDYVYKPLGGSRKGRLRTLLNTFIVFTLSGLWHGANWTYVLWGMISAAVVILEILLRDRLASDKTIVVYLKRVGLYCFFALTAILFRAESVAQYGELLARLFTGFVPNYFSATFDSLGLTPGSFFQLVLTFVCMNLIYRFSRYENRPSASKELSAGVSVERSLYAQRMFVYLYALIAVMLCWIAVLDSGDMNAFLYFQF